MKKTALLLSFIILNTLIFSQEYKDLFFGKDTSLYKNYYFKIRKNDIAPNNTFYQNLDSCKKTFLSPKVLFPKSDNKNVTNLDSLENSIFSLNKIYINEYSKYDKYIFELYDTVKKNTIYYRYNDTYSHIFNFKLCEREIKIKHDYCLDFDIKIDEFENIKTINYPYFTNLNPNKLNISKSISKTSTQYYLYAELEDSYLTVNCNNIIILFEDGTKWIKNTKVDVDAGKDGYSYSVFILLNQLDLKTFQSKKIKGFKIGVFDYYFKNLEPEYFMNSIECIKNAK